MWRKNRFALGSGLPGYPSRFRKLCAVRSGGTVHEVCEALAATH